MNTNFISNSDWLTSVCCCYIYELWLFSNILNNLNSVERASSISTCLPSRFLFLSLLFQLGLLKSANEDYFCFLMSATVVLPILNLSAITFREAPGLSNFLRNSILVANVVAVLPGMVDGGNTNDNYDRKCIAYNMKRSL